MDEPDTPSCHLSGPRAEDTFSSIVEDQIICQSVLEI